MVIIIKPGGTAEVKAFVPVIGTKVFFIFIFQGVIQMVKVPHRLYLSEDEMPKQWYNLRADMKELPDPMINPGTMKPAAVEDLYPVFCEELAKQ